ncbi:EAL domain-containing protein [Denitratisoma oestradiolicum]|nr:EAL domain-containing protein [Denitratisoma oestradiolicum]
MRQPLMRLIAGIATMLALFMPRPGWAEESPPSASIRVVMDDNYPPYAFRDEEGRLQGILPDLWALWETRSRIKVRIQAMDWAKAQQVMRAGRADVIDTMFENEQRRQFYDFSSPYATIEVPIFFHHSISGIVGPDSLKGFTIGVKDGDACIDRLLEYGIVNFRRFPNYDTLIRAAAGHEVRVMCIDKPPALYLLYRFGLEKEFRYSNPLYSGAFHRAVRKGNGGMLQLVEEGFARISTAERKAVEDKWLGAALSSHSRQAFTRYATVFLTVTGLLALILVLWNWQLRRRVAVKTQELTCALASLGEAKSQTEQTRDHLEATLEAIPDLLFELDGEGRYLDYRARDPGLLAAPAEQLLGRTVSEMLPGPAAQVVLDALREAGETGTSHGAQLLLPLAGGDAWFELSVARKKSAPGERGRYIVLSRDITERKQAEADIERLAFFDSLTQLPNRNQLHERLRQALAASMRRGGHGALLFIDLDDFKTLNDTRGHRAGDLLLLEAAQRLQSCVRTEDFVARLGGDEFVVMLESLSADAEEAALQAETVGEKILALTRLPYWIEQHEQHSTASLGITLFSGQGHTADELLKRADAAMYRAKTAGRNTMRFFDPGLQASLEARTLLEAALRRALPEGQLLLHYQAQVNAMGQVVGAEALLRWQHPTRGMVSPMQFISLAEESGLIIPIGGWVLETACAQLNQWEKMPVARGLKLSVNVSARQFRQADFVPQVSEILQRMGTNPALLKIELTESLVLDDVTGTIEKMHALKAMGVRCSMDDFGTGYSSLSYLKRLPLDQLKIDRSFVRDIATDEGDAVIVQTIIGMAHNLGLDVIAEGVETEAQQEFLVRHGCTVFQGFLFSRPLPVAEFESMLENRTSSRCG